MPDMKCNLAPGIRPTRLVKSQKTWLTFQERGLETLFEGDFIR